MAAIRFDTQPEWEAGALCRELANMDRVAMVRVMLTDLVQTSIQTCEKSMRSKDGPFAGLLVIEGLDERPCVMRSGACRLWLHSSRGAAVLFHLCRRLVLFDQRMPVTIELICTRVHPQDMRLWHDRPGARCRDQL